MRTRAVIIHGLADARMACAVAGELGLPITLLSAPGAAASMGPLWFQQIVSEIEAEFSGLALDTVFDCGDSPGHALAALRQGLEHVRYSGPETSRHKIVAIARRSRARIDTGPPAAAFDPAEHAEPEVACRLWFTGRKAPPAPETRPKPDSNRG